MSVVRVVVRFEYIASTPRSWIDRHGRTVDALIAARATCWSAGSSVNVTESAALVGASSCSNSAWLRCAARNCCTPPQAPQAVVGERSPRRRLNEPSDRCGDTGSTDCLFDRVGRTAPLAARIHRAELRGRILVAGLLGSRSVRRSKELDVADCATMTAKSRRMIVARMRRRRDTISLLQCVVVDCGGRRGIDALQLFADYKDTSRSRSRRRAWFRNVCSTALVGCYAAH